MSEAVYIETCLELKINVHQEKLTFIRLLDISLTGQIENSSSWDRSSQEWSSRDRSCQDRSSWDKSSQDWSNKFGSNIKSEQVNSNWDRSNQVMTVKFGLVKSDR